MITTIQFLVTGLLAIGCAHSLSMSQGDVPALALVVPALWLMPKTHYSGVTLLGALGVYALTLEHQPVALSVAVWSVFPLLMVMFSPKSNTLVVVVSSMILVTLWIGVMATQADGQLDGSPILSLTQLVCVLVAWWASKHWQASQERRWWVFALLVPMWIAQWYEAVLLAVTLTVLFALIERLNAAKSVQWEWGTLMCWTLPSVAFASLMVNPSAPVPNSVFVVWLCLLAAAWMTDYLINEEDEESDEY